MFKLTQPFLKEKTLKARGNITLFVRAYAFVTKFDKYSSALVLYIHVHV